MKTVIRPLFALVYLLLVAPVGALQDSGATAFTRLDAELAARARELRFSGVVAVARNGKILHESIHGDASLEHGVAHRRDTRFKLHSLSKPLLATLLVKSVEAGRVELDTLVGEYLVDWPLAWSDVTVRHLASHTSGVPEIQESFLERWSGSALSTWESMAMDLSEESVAFEPGSGWSYCNAGYVLLAAVLEAVWDQPLEDVLASRLTRPLEMSDTVLEVTPSWSEIAYDGHRVVPHLATGYNGSPADLQVAHSKTYAIPGAGGIISTGHDLCTFAHAVFETEFLRPDSRAAMTAAVPAGQGMAYGLGWGVRRRGDLEVFSHTGGNNGFVTSLEYYPEPKVTIVILSNFGFVPMGELRDRVAEHVLAALE